MAPIQVTRLASLTREIAAAMQVSFNGESYEDVAALVECGKYALVRGDTQQGSAYAIISEDGDCVCIEAVEGAGGLDLTQALVLAALRAGKQCHAWVLSLGRMRLARRAGLQSTGTFRMSASGAIQHQVSTP